MKTNISTLALGCVLLPSVNIKAAEKIEKPNIIFILEDDLGWADLPMYGNKFNEAPNLTKLASQGVQFSNAYAAGPVSSPTRASIMSGQCPARVGIIDFIPGHFRPYEEVTVPRNRTQYLPEEVVTIAESLKKAGYATGYFGKWHLGEETNHHPLNQGFDEANIGQGFYNTIFKPAREQSKDKIISERLTDFGIDFIDKHKKEPFFLYVAHWEVHCPYDSEKELIDKYLKKPKVDGYPCNAVYAAMIEQLDKTIGRLLEKLDKEGLTNNTIVFFYSDNGGVISENKYPEIKEEKFPMLMPSKQQIYKDDNNPLQYIGTSNAPLRGEKATLYEGGIREPLIIKWPAKLKGGKRTKAIVSSIDFYPSFLELAGVEKPENQVLDGISLLPCLLKNEFDADRVLFWHYPVYHHDVPAAAVRKGEWKLFKNLVTNTVVLYNLTVDLGETTDLSAVYPDKTKELNQLLENWQKEVKAEFPIPNPNFDKNKRYEWGNLTNHP